MARMDLEGVASGEPPSSNRLTLDGVPCDVATLAGVLLGVFRIGLF